RVRQVLVNLIGNAVKFTPQDDAIVVTTALHGAGDAARGEIRVSDTGPGIAAAEQVAIFEPYYRSEGTAQAPGVGLGLAISRGLVEQMNGELLLESEPGAGTTFIIRLPLAQESGGEAGDEAN
ncbi:MAG TPA: ATP-binding protein, partial [Longimicrobium sp.]|nr:ATP-binding protein [Longimicrobium sp.]